MNDERLKEGVRNAYSAAAERPGEKHPFPLGREFAESLGYPQDLIDNMPRCAVDAFAGVSNVSVFADIPESAAVLDLGCGAGLDSFIAASRTGPEGRIIGVDFSAAMLKRALKCLSGSNAENVEFRLADAECLPLEDNSVDVALANGIFNLNINREAIFKELARVVRPGGKVYAAEIILKDEQGSDKQCDLTNWFA